MTMPCPACGGPTRVLDSRPSAGNVRRSRECRKCRAHFSTYEVYRSPSLDGRGRHARADVVNRIGRIIEELAQIAEPLERIERATTVGLPETEGETT